MYICIIKTTNKKNQCEINNDISLMIIAQVLQIGLQNMSKRNSFSKEKRMTIKNNKIEITRFKTFFQRNNTKQNGVYQEY